MYGDIYCTEHIFPLATGARCTLRDRGSLLFLLGDRFLSSLTERKEPGTSVSQGRLGDAILGNFREFQHRSNSHRIN